MTRALTADPWFQVFLNRLPGCVVAYFFKGHSTGLTSVTCSDVIALSLTFAEVSLCVSTDSAPSNCPYHMQGLHRFKALPCAHHGKVHYIAE